MASAATMEPEAVCGRAMTRCECAEVAFTELPRVARELGLAPAEVARRSGCGQTCTACIPDLERFLAGG